MTNPLDVVGALLAKHWWMRSVVLGLVAASLQTVVVYLEDGGNADILAWIGWSFIVTALATAYGLGRRSAAHDREKVTQ